MFHIDDNPSGAVEIIQELDSMNAVPDLEIQAVLLDEVVASHDKPSNDHIIKLEVKSLRDTRQLLEKVGINEAFQFVEDNRHPRLCARKNFSPSNLLTLYKAQIRPSLEYCSHIWGAAAPTTLSILDAVQRRAIRLIGDPALTCHLQPLSHRRAVGDLSLFYRYSNGFCSFELTSIIPPLSKPARCTRGTSSSHPKAVVLHTSRTE
nr:unnamed protein product [Callosobruchus chinensis]